MDGHRFVFVGGLHRSGTTLLADLIADHPEVSGLSGTGVPMNEGQFLQGVYPPAWTKRTLWPIRYLRPVAPRLVSHRGYGGPGRFVFDPGSHLTETSPLATRENAQAVFNSWAPYLDLDRQVLIEKSPPNLLRTRFLQALYPGASFIIVMRHPVAVSYATRAWTRIRPLYFLFKHWVLGHHKFEMDAPHVDRLLVLRYEDLVAKPEEVMRQIHHFLDLPHRPVNRHISSNANQKYFDIWNARMSGPHIRSRYMGFLCDNFAQAFARYGYSLDAPL